jgi:hypothetical protein
VLAPLVLAATVAALTPSEVVFLDTATLTPVARAALPCPGLGLFAAPDGRMLVPLGCEDVTLALAGAVDQERWRGRVFPLFFSEWDRMYVVLRHAVASWSYPDRAALGSVALSSLEGTRRAACSRDGRVVAVVPDDPLSQVLVVTVMGDHSISSAPLGAPATAMVVAPEGAFVVVGQSNGFLTFVPVGGGPQAEKQIADKVLALCWSPDDRDLLASVETQTGPALLTLRVTADRAMPVRERHRTVLPAAALDIVPADTAIAAATAKGVLLIAKAGRGTVRLFPLPGVSRVAVPPVKTRSALPSWQEPD